MTDGNVCIHAESRTNFYIERNSTYFCLPNSYNSNVQMTTVELKKGKKAEFPHCAIDALARIG